MYIIGISHLERSLSVRATPLIGAVARGDFLEVNRQRGGWRCVEALRRASQNTMRLSLWLDVQNSSGWVGFHEIWSTSSE